MERFAVSLEICHILSKEQADAVAGVIRDALAHIDEDIYLCVGTYEQVAQKGERIRLVAVGHQEE